MTIDRRLLAGMIGLTLVLAACGASTATSGTTAATAAPTNAAVTEAPAATEAPDATEAPAATEEPDDGVDLGSGQVNDLAGLLPEEAGGVTFERVGYDGDQLGLLGAAAGLNSEDLDPILKANGKTLNDVNFAIATSTSATGGMIYAIQIEGVDAMEFAASMGMDPSSMPKTTLGGKTVFGEAASGFGAFAYPAGDKLFMVLLMDEKTSASVFERLP